MKKLLLITATIFLIQMSNAQTIDYFGQTPPGNTAIKFAPGIISRTDRLEAKVAFSSDGSECYFEVVDIKDNKASYKIYYTKRDNNSWTEQVEAPFSVNNNVGSPYFSRYGKKLYYIKYNSDQTNSDIWVVEDSVGVWSYPQLLPEPINSASMELNYSETTDSIIYFDSNRPDGNGGYDIWCKQPSFARAENLGKVINSNLFDSDPCVAPDGSYLIFSTERFLSVGGNLLCISFNKGNNEWTTPINMNRGGANINNSIAHHGNPSLSPDGKYLFFMRHSELTDMDIYWVSTSIIDTLKKIAFPTTLIEASETESIISIFPNPTTGLVNISLYNSVKNAIVEIYDLQGSMVISKIIFNEKNATVDLSGCANGMYMIRTIADGYVNCVKVTKELLR